MEEGVGAHTEGVDPEPTMDAGMIRDAKLQVKIAEMKRLKVMPSIIGGHLEGMASRALCDLVSSMATRTYALCTSLLCPALQGEYA